MDPDVHTALSTVKRHYMLDSMRRLEATVVLRSASTPASRSIVRDACMWKTALLSTSQPPLVDARTGREGG